MAAVVQIADRVAGGALLQSLDLPSAIGAEEAGEPTPGMLTAGERALLTELVRRTWRGAGAIVDGGSFLGSSLVAEARGLAASPVLPEVPRSRFPGERPIHGYELGIHPAPANPAADRRRSYGGQEYLLGESFVPLLERNIADHRDLIELHIGDLTAMSWDGSPVELAFVDVCKTAELNAHVTREFYPALIEGGSTLVHQDFFFDMLPWIRVTMGYLADHFRWEGQAASSSVYTCVKAVPPEVAAYDPFTEASLEQCLAFHDAVEFPGIDRTAQLMLALSRVHLMVQKGGHERALAELGEVAVTYADILGDPPHGDSYQPMPGTPETMRPRFRMDRAVTQALSAVWGRGAGGTAPAAPAAATAAPSEFDRARAALERRDWDGARRILEPLVASDQRGTARFLLARTELESGRTDLAGALLDELLADRPRHQRARVLRARAHLLAGDLDAARRTAETALDPDPRLVVARRVLFDIDVATRLRAQESRRTT